MTSPRDGGSPGDTVLTPNKASGPQAVPILNPLNFQIVSPPIVPACFIPTFSPHCLIADPLRLGYYHPGSSMTAITIDAPLLAAMLTLPGWTWTAFLYSPKTRERTNHWITTLLALMLSLALILTSCLFLGSIGRLHLNGLLPFLAIVACLGFILDYKKGASQALQHLGWGLLTCLILSLLFILLRLIPYHSDWIVGGWDPGVIMNQGFCIGQTGTTHPLPGLTAPLLAADDQSLFSRTLSGLREAFPGIPVDPNTGAWNFYFCPITPLTVSLLYQVGGATLALIMPLVVGVVAILMFSGVTTRSTPLFLVPLLFLLQPILIYHCRTPTSEITELLLLGAFMTLWTNATPGGLRRWLGASLIFLATVNRVSFELFGAWLILIVACMDTECEDRRFATFDHAALMIGLLAGMAYYSLVSPDSLAKLTHVTPSLHIAVLLLLAGAFALDQFCLARPVRKGVRWDLILLGFGLLAFCVLEQCSTVPWTEFRQNTLALSAYTGWMLIGIAVPGFCLLFRRPDKSTYWALFFLFALLIVLRHKHAAELYPWALKRYLVYAVPLLAIAAGAALMAFWNHRRINWVAPALLLGVFIANASLCRHAWSTPDYEGVSKQLNEVAKHIGDRDIVIADHFRWGTPLALAYGRNVINGERIWAGRDPVRVRHAVSLVQQHTGNNGNVYFLTSTPGALDVYLDAIPETEKVWSAKPWTTRRIEHHRNNRSFATREVAATFQLFKINTRPAGTRE